MSNKVYHVAKNGNDEFRGTKEQPFLTINHAASIAEAGDKVIVHQGVYREWIKSLNKGLDDNNRIVFEAASDEKVVIKGSEIITDWEVYKESVWKVDIPNHLFGDFNPYSIEVDGDFISHYTEERKHLGEVYLNGKSFFEVSSIEKVLSPQMRKETIDDWTRKTVDIQDFQRTNFVWFAEVSNDYTTIYANFHDFDPNTEEVEINVRRSIFYPDKTGRDYITVRGFEMAHAATPWTPPTADQPGLIGPNWSKGWIIEDNIIHDAKCSAISIGKEKETGHNFRTLYKDKPGYQYQLETVFMAVEKGWSKDNVGSHIIRNNEIYNCGQNAIVGHLGCIFSEIYDNHIHNIGTKYEFYGHEIAGIKLHAAIDTQIYRNRIHNCTLGTWLDWQTQGTRLSKNIYYKNNRDLFVEVSHGPYVVDHNIFGSEAKLDIFAQGGAYINNLFCGLLNPKKVLDRATPYHYPHSTRIKGYAVVYGGDDRFYGNVFIPPKKIKNGDMGTSVYNGHTTSLKEYIEKVDSKSPGDLDIFMQVEQPVYINNNIYFDGAQPFSREVNNYLYPDFNPGFEIIEDENSVFISFDLPDSIQEWTKNLINSKSLPKPRIAAYDFEDSDGNEIILDTDLLGENVGIVKIGPVFNVEKGKNQIKIW